MGEPYSLLYLLQVASSSFPTGSFSHSGGFETLIQEGAIGDAESLESAVQQWVRYGLARADGAAVALAERVEVGGRDDPEAALAELDESLTALKLARESREASLKMGDAFLRAAGDAFGGERLAAYGEAVRAGLCVGHYATAFGVAAADAGVSVPQAVLAFLFGSYSNVVAVAARLIPLGQLDTHRILARSRPHLVRCARVSLDTKLADLGAATVCLDLAAMRHERLYSRLCIS